MAPGSPAIVVCGATGRIAGAVIKALLARGGFDVVALVRYESAAKSRALASQGARLAKGDMDDPASLERAFAGAAGVFSVQEYGEDEKGAQHDFDLEVKRARNVANACHAAKVKHLVYISSASADRGTGIRHFEVKYEVEKYIKQLQVPATMLRPVCFMEMMEKGAIAAPQPGVARGLTDAGVRRQWVSMEDVGAFAALCFADPKKWIGTEVELAGDELTGNELAEAYSAECGYPFTYSPPPLLVLRIFASEFYAMAQWFARDGHHADIAKLRALYPFKTVTEWLHETKVGEWLPRPDPSWLSRLFHWGA